jgi:hypothetical protein
MANAPHCRGDSTGYDGPVKRTASNGGMSDVVNPICEQGLALGERRHAEDRRNA